MKKLLGVILSLALLLSLSVPAFADWRGVPEGEPYPVEGGNIYIDWSTNTVVDADETVTSAVIPDGITGIGDMSFLLCGDTLTSVTIPDGVTSIGTMAFSGSGLTGLTLPDSVTSIGDWAFSDCTGLTGLTLPEGITQIGLGAFSDCGMKSVSVPASVTSIGESAFDGVDEVNVAAGNKTYSSKDGVLFLADGKTLVYYPAANPRESYSIPDGVATIAAAAFDESYNLNAVTIPDSVTTIERGAFTSCNDLVNVTIPGSVTSIEDYAFYDCTSLTGVTISDGVATIELNAFYNCYALTEVTIPASVTYIDETAFSGCTNLAAFNVDGGSGTYSSVDGVLYTADGKAAFMCPEGKKGTYTVPDGVTTIMDYAFYNSSLTGVTLPDSVTNIGEEAFEYSKLTGVVIPGSVTSIGDDAFLGCRNMLTAFIPASVANLGNSAFEYCYNLNDVYYAGSEAQWKAISRVAFGYDFDKEDFAEPSANIHCNAVPPTDGSFIDAQPGGDYTDAINWAVENNFAAPSSSAAFGTDVPCPRWEVVEILWKALGSTAPTTSVSPFYDVWTDDPYYDAVLWASENKIALGKDIGEFGTYDTVNRGEAITFIHRAAKNPASSAANRFTDVKDGDFFYVPVLWGVEKGIVYGTSATTFSPEDSVTRGQLVTFLYRWAVENK